MNNRPKCTLLILLVVTAAVIVSASIDVMFEKIEQVNGTHIYDLSKIRVRKFNRTIWVLDGTMDLLVDGDDRYEISVIAAYSSLGNNQFNQYPMKIAPHRLCQFFSTTWREYYSYFKDCTNFPEIGACPVTAKQYYAKNLILDSNIFPPYLPRGLWRSSVIMKMVGNEDIVARTDVYFKVEPKGVF
ncbi:uncharacterized protein LOC129728848 [Wyeomyia smithii]|uniref:uncharacterized protein LOC129728848 n=1 Tax=Wyeomyia smithii TaxID=174621 RepID=UPI002467C0D5|nr:uncharacterized protein LOC129728848 [Wyeomyia smithii]